jgi:hypothetical protein
MIWPIEATRLILTNQDEIKSLVASIDHIMNRGSAVSAIGFCFPDPAEQTCTKNIPVRQNRPRTRRHSRSVNEDGQVGLGGTGVAWQVKADKRRATREATRYHATTLPRSALVHWSGGAKHRGS